MSPRSVPRKKSEAEEVLGTEDASLLDIVDNVLNKGVVLSGDLTLALANVDLVYAQLAVLLCAADRVLPAASQNQRRLRSRKPQVFAAAVPGRKA